MATLRNRHGKWQARVQRNGQQPFSKSFQSKEDAQRWVRQIDKGSYTSIALAERTLFKDVIERYVQEVTLKIRSMREDSYRLRVLARHLIAKLRMTALTPIKVAEISNSRLEADPL